MATAGFVPVQEQHTLRTADQTALHPLITQIRIKPPKISNQPLQADINPMPVVTGIARPVNGWMKYDSFYRKGHEIDAINYLGVFWALINEPPPGSVKISS